LLAAGGGGLDPARLAASAAYLAEADGALDWIVAEALRSRVERTDDGRILADLEGLPREIARRILVRLIADGDSQVDGPTLDRAMARLDAGQVATLGKLKLSPGRRISIEKAPLRR
jgi:tRNA(Ile)-lysidine synthase